MLAVESPSVPDELDAAPPREDRPPEEAPPPSEDRPPEPPFSPLRRELSPELEPVVDAASVPVEAEESVPVEPESVVPVVEVDAVPPAAFCAMKAAPPAMSALPA